MRRHAFRFPGSVAVVTGGASGIGRASALAFARRGADVVVADVDADGAGRVAGEIETTGRAAVALRADVGDREQVEDLVDRAIAWKGHCDLFFSNAGVGVAGAPDLVPLEDWEWIVRVNLWSQVWAVRRVLPHMLERGSGYLLHTASVSGLLGNPATTPYVVTKFAVVGLAESLAIRLRGTGIGVSVVCPMVVATNLTLISRATVGAGVDESEKAALRERAHRRMQTAGISPDAVAESVVAGVEEGTLYVLPHPEALEFVRRKWHDPDRWLDSMAYLWRTAPEALGDPSGP